VISQIQIKKRPELRIWTSISVYTGDSSQKKPSYTSSFSFNLFAAVSGFGGQSKTDMKSTMVHQKGENSCESY